MCFTSQQSAFSYAQYLTTGNDGLLAPAKVRPFCSANKDLPPERIDHDAPGKAD
jgi:hypothetical protein